MPVIGCPNCDRGVLKANRKDEVEGVDTTYRLKCDSCNTEFPSIPEDAKFRSLDSDILRVFEDHGVDIEKYEIETEDYERPGDIIKWVITGKHKEEGL